MAHAFRNEPDPADANRGRYALYVDGALVSVADWTVNGDAIAFPHTYTVPKHRGHGYAGELVDRAMDDVEQGGEARRADVLVRRAVVRGASGAGGTADALTGR